MEINNIKVALKDSGISKGDILMIHGDAGIAAQINSKKKDKLKIFFDEVEKYIGNKGTILVPTFTYSSCNKKIFYKEKTVSSLGLFSENFRKRKNVKRTAHPIYSFSIYGKNFRYFNNAKITTCFGKESIFDLFKKINGKILCAGCSFNRMTFIHSAEEAFGVNYRFKKNFPGIIYLNNKKYKVNTEYYVRKINNRSKLNLKYFYNYLIKRNKISNVSCGRYNILTIKAKVLFQNSLKVLKKNSNFLVKK